MQQTRGQWARYIRGRWIKAILPWRPGGCWDCAVPPRTFLTAPPFSFRETYHMGTFSRYPLRICSVAALLVGCGGVQPIIGAPDPMPQSPTVTSRGGRGTLAAEPHDTTKMMLQSKRRRPLLYVVNFDPAYSDVTIYDAKAKTPTPSGTITDGLFEPQGDCIDSQGGAMSPTSPGVVRAGSRSTGLAAQNLPGRSRTASIFQSSVQSIFTGTFGSQISVAEMCVGIRGWRLDPSHCHYKGRSEPEWHCI